MIANISCNTSIFIGQFPSIEKYKGLFIMNIVEIVALKENQDDPIPRFQEPFYTP